MIPSVNDILTTQFDIEEQPDKTYKLDVDNNIINGQCDDLQAIKQAVIKILNTERYQNIIYSWNYGIETADLIGEPITYVCPEVKQRIIDALSQDERIIDVDEFEFEVLKGKVHVSFTVHTIYGEIKSEKVVNF